VRERCEVPARAEAAPRFDDRVDALVHHRDEVVDDGLPNPRVPLHQGVDPTGHHRPDGLDGEFRPRARCVAPDQIGLEGVYLLGRDPFVDEFAEAGVDAVHRLAALDDVLYPLSGPSNRFAGVVRDGHFGRARERRRRPVQGERLAVEDDLVRVVSPPDSSTTLTSGNDGLAALPARSGRG